MWPNTLCMTRRRLIHCIPLLRVLKWHLVNIAHNIHKITSKRLPITSKCSDGLNAFLRPLRVVLRKRSSFKRLGTDMDQVIKKATKKCQDGSKHPKKVVAVEENKHSNKATQRHITANKHPKIYFSVYCWGGYYLLQGVPMLDILNMLHHIRDDCWRASDYILDTGQN
ncbi:hypothetical protein Ahy_B04g069178 isoform A [Arachis hypogaea]|uniref:Uncharacterized protein n=1 Tax=Arachis hypogaea TaxID=3818 RepID=A0A444ZBU2_ARAHY|nr:hypothetical protein Ahy_B04g069178 isoform A [Arachis hypogaea]